MNFPVHPSTFGNQPRAHLNSGISCSNNRGHFCFAVSNTDDVEEVTNYLRAFSLVQAQLLFQWLIESRLSPLLISTPGLRDEPPLKGLPNRQLRLSAARAGDIQARRTGF